MRLLCLAVFIGIFSSCREEFHKYERPEWLKGKLYSQIKATEGLDSFALCIVKTGLDSVLDVSGLFTVFAPTNEAFQNFFQESPEYNQISDIPPGELDNIVKYHIIQNSWTLKQLMSLDISGWSGSPRGFKRQTLYKADNRKYWVKFNQRVYTLSDSISSNRYRIVYNPSRKYVPFFFDNFLKIAGITGSDYEFFFNTEYSPGKMHFAGSNVISSEIYAENGILYTIDGVVLPMKNTEELLEQQYNDYSYSEFLRMIYKYGTLTQNMPETMKIPAFKIGMDVDTLYNLAFPGLIFNIQSELTSATGRDATETIRYHFGLIAPTNQAINELFSQVITGPNRWPNAASVPSVINKIIINSHMISSPVYLTNLTQGFKNGENDFVFVDPSAVVQSEYSSNSSFIGVNKAIIPRAFSSVTGPVYLRPDYSVYRNALEYTKVVSVVKSKDYDISLFVVPDVTLNADSSLMFSPLPQTPEVIRLVSYNRADKKIVNRSSAEMFIQLFNHVGVAEPSGISRKEFIPNLAGNYIVFDWENNNVSGGVNSVYGFYGDSVIHLMPELLDDPTDNGRTYSINGWLAFSQTSLYNAVTGYSEFLKLLDRANLRDKLNNTLKFIRTRGERYTVFIPSDAALQKYNTSQMTQIELEQFIRYHFIKGDIIFTHGKESHRNYSTLRLDESKGGYTDIMIKPGVDVIDILNADGTLYYRINEQSGKTNIMVGENINLTGVPNYITIGVIHVIDTVLVK